MARTDYDVEHLMGELMGEEYNTMGEEFATVGDELGEAVAAVAKVSPALARKMAENIAKNPRIAKNFTSGPMLTYLRPLGLAADNIGADTTVNVTSQPQREFRPERIVIADGPAANAGVAASIPPASLYQITDILCGTTSQMMSTDPLNADAYVATAFGVRLMMTTVSPAIQFTLKVRNLDTVAHKFRAQVFGKAAAPT